MPKAKTKKLTIKLTETHTAQQSGSGWSLKGVRGGALFFPSLHALVAHMVVVDPTLLMGSVEAPLTPDQFVARMDELIAALQVSIPNCTCQS